jgi:hypothetical protein
VSPKLEIQDPLKRSRHAAQQAETHGRPQVVLSNLDFLWQSASGELDELAASR